MDSWKEAPEAKESTYKSEKWIGYFGHCVYVLWINPWLLCMDPYKLCALPKEGSLSECEALRKCARHQVLQWRCSGLFGELLLSWSWLETLEESECIPVLSRIWNVEAFFSLVDFCLLEVGLWAFTERGSDWEILTHTSQYLEVILLWFYAPLSSRVLIFKSIFVFIFSHIKFSGLYSGSLKFWSFESWVKEIFKNSF